MGERTHSVRHGAENVQTEHCCHLPHLPRAVRFWLPLLSLLTSFCFGLAPTFGFDAGVMLALAMFFLAFVSLILLGACLATSRAPLRPPQPTLPGPTPLTNSLARTRTRIPSHEPTLVPDDADLTLRVMSKGKKGGRGLILHVGVFICASTMATITVLGGCPTAQSRDFSVYFIRKQITTSSMSVFVRFMYGHHHNV